MRQNTTRYILIPAVRRNELLHCGYLTILGCNAPRRFTASGISARGYVSNAKSINCKCVIQ